MKALLIAEKPSLMRTIKAVYDKYGHKDIIDFDSFVGHTLTLQPPSEYKAEWGGSWSWNMLPIIPEKFKYKVNNTTRDVYLRLREKVLNGNYDYIINATDPDREGENIFWSFCESLGKTNDNLVVKRFWSNDLTEKKVKSTLENLRSGKEEALINLGTASKLRARFDWLVGMNFTVATTLQMGGNLTVKVGRVKTPILKILVDRENEILNFKTEEFLQLQGEFKTPCGEFKGDLIDNDKICKFKDKNEVEKIIEGIKDKECIVESLESIIKLKNPPQLYTLNTIQEEASKLYSYLPEKTKNIVQSLYEKKLLSYPRTDCPYISTEIAKDFPVILRPILQIESLSEQVKKIIDDDKVLKDILKNNRYVNDKKLEESGHYAIIPTGEILNKNHLTQEEFNVYEMVARRVVSIFMPPLKVSVSTLITSCSNHLFRTVGKMIIDDGFYILYKRNNSTSEDMIPNLKKGDKVQLLNCLILEKQTTPPKRFTDGTLIPILENPSKLLIDKSLKTVIQEHKGIGTVATRDQIINQLVSDGYAKRISKNKKTAPTIVPTEEGMKIIENLKGKEIVSIDMTGKWENKLANVENGKITESEFTKDMNEYALKTIDDIKNTSMNIITTLNNLKQLKGKCPKCNSEMKIGKQYYFCSNYKKNCDFIVGKTILGASISITDIEKLLKGDITDEKLLTKKDKTTFKSRFVIKDKELKLCFEKANQNKTPKKVIATCPICKQNILSGEKYYLCSDYKKNCNVIIAKKINGADITEKDAIDLFNNKTVEKNFTWKNGRKSFAVIKYIIDKEKKNGRIQYDFIR